MTPDENMASMEAAQRAAAIAETLRGCTKKEVIDTMGRLPNKYKDDVREWTWSRYKFGNAAAAEEFVSNVERLLSEVVQKRALDSNCFVW